MICINKLFSIVSRLACILGGGITGLASLLSKQVGEFAGLAKIPPSSKSLQKNSYKACFCRFLLFKKGRFFVLPNDREIRLARYSWVLC